MDPAAIVLQGFLNAPGAMYRGLTRERPSYELTTIDTENNGVPVTYSYQLWQVKTPTVCAKYKQDIAIYAPCTEAAKDLFHEACTHFSQRKNKNHAHRKAAEMYCYAANTYQPTIARVEAPGMNAELEEARAACNAAVAGMIGNSSGRQKAEKEKLCSRYKKLREGR